jgi:hypothetical protein
MSQIATGPNGQPMIALSPDQSAAEARQARCLTNMRHERADRIPVLRDRLIAEEIDLRVVAVSNSGKTLRWDIPRQIAEGPHAGKWGIYVPANETRRYSRDPRTGDTVERPAPEWAGAEIAEMDPAWWPRDDASK